MIRLQKLRYDAGLTPEQLGELVDVAGKTIRRIESGGVPRPSIAKKLADHFSVTATALLEEVREDVTAA